MYFRPVYDIFISYLIFFGLIAAVVIYKPGLFLLTIAAIFLSLTLHRLGLFIHSASHHEFHRHQEKSDQVYRAILGWFFGVNMKIYRKIHFDHHKHHGNCELDPEDTYSKGFNLNSVKNLMMRRDPSSLAVKKYLEQISSKEPLRYVAYALHLSLLILCTYSLGISGFFFYAGSVFIGLPTITHLRNCLEHTPPLPYETSEQATSRNFNRGPVAFFMGAAGFQLHSSHHARPSTKYWQLDQNVPKTSYYKAFRRISRNA